MGGWFTFRCILQESIMEKHVLFRIINDRQERMKWQIISEESAELSVDEIRWIPASQTEARSE